MFELILTTFNLIVNFFYLKTAKILVFYVVLYAFLAAFFAAMLLVFFQTLDLYQPRWQNSNGLIGTNPGKCECDTE